MDRGIFREDGFWSKIFRFEQQATQIMPKKFAHSFYQSHGRAITQLADQQEAPVCCKSG
jgi:hypothetical protein